MTQENEEKQAEEQTQAEPEEQTAADEDFSPSGEPGKESSSDEAESGELESPEGNTAEETVSQLQQHQPATDSEESQPETTSVEEIVSSEPSDTAEKPPAGEAEESGEPEPQALEPTDAGAVGEPDQQAEVPEVEQGVSPKIAETEEESEEISPEADKLKEIIEDPDKRWYVIHAHSGHENKVRQSLENRVRQEHLEEFVGKILIPSEEVAEVKGGKKRISSRKIFPGYVLIQMKLTHETWYLIRTTPGVTGFIGSGKTPTPLEQEEVQSIFDQMRGERKKPKPKMTFEKDEKVKIIEGPFTNFMGYVDEVNPERGKLKVMVEIFERLTSVELEFWQVEKI